MDIELTRPLLTWSIPFPWTAFNIHVHENNIFFFFLFVSSKIRYLKKIWYYTITFKGVSIYSAPIYFFHNLEEGKIYRKILISTLSFRRHLCLSIDQSATILPPSREETPKRIQRLINKSSDPRRLCRNVFLLLWNPKSNEVTNPSSRKKFEILENFKKKNSPSTSVQHIQQQGNEKNDEIVRKFYLKITWKCPIL